MVNVTRISNMSDLVEAGLPRPNMGAETALLQKQEWEDLLFRAANKSVFMTWEWLVTWWEVYGGSYDLWWLISKNENGKVIGGLPLYVWKGQDGLFLPHRELRFVGTGASVSPEHLDIVIDPEHFDEVVLSISQYLIAHLRDWDLMLLTDISNSSAFVNRLFDELLTQGGTLSVEKQEPQAPYVSLPPSWEEYLRSLSPRMRAHILRNRRKLNRELEITFHIWSHADGSFKQAFNEFERLFRDRKVSVGIGDKFEEARGYRKFHHLLAERFSKRGWLYLAFLRTPEKTIAAEYIFKYLNTIYSYQFGFDRTFVKKNVFKVLRGYVIEDAIQLGITEFDLLRGEEPYKYDWGTRSREKKMIRYFSPTLYGQTLRHILEFKRAGKRMLHNTVSKMKKVEAKNE